MKIRIISGLIGVLILVGVLFLNKTIVYPICIAAISVIALFELFKAYDCLKYRISFGVSCVAAISNPICCFYNKLSIANAVIVFAVMLIFLECIIRHSIQKFNQTAFMLAVTMLIIKAMGMLVCLKQMDSKYGLIYVILALSSAWVADTGAYFAGTFFGKHKLCPNISPKKTIEGLCGGILLTIIAFVVFSLIYSNITEASVQYIWLVVIAIVCALVGVLGDLSASILKRQRGIKDFGNIMPGHGGVMDRFDSVLFTLPVFYALNLLIPIYK